LFSTLTCSSAIASSSADCVRGVVRLISSARMMFAKTGPGLNSNCPLLASNTDTPRTSPGSRSGVS
jgi:hypothetical protein